MPGISVAVDLAPIKAQIKDIYQRQVPFIASLALNATMKDVVAAEQAEMRADFDRPTPWTLNSMQVEPSNKDQGDLLTAAVGFKDFGGTPAWKYLNPEIQGGPRRRKSHELRLLERGIMRADEFAVPGAGVTLDQYGNMPGALITRILSALSASPDAYQNITRRSKRGAIARSGGVYFVRREAGAPPGIYQRLAGRRIIPVILFVRTPHYAPRLPAYERAKQVVRDRFAPHFWESWRLQSPSFRP